MSYTQDEIIVPRNVEEEIKESYLRYSMSVIISRALARCARWLKALAAAHFLCDAPIEFKSRRQTPKMRQDLRGYIRGLPPSRRNGDLSDACPYGSRLGDALSA